MTSRRRLSQELLEHGREGEARHLAEHIIEDQTAEIAEVRALLHRI